MTLIVKPDRRAPTAVHMVWVRVGSMDEVDGISGVAHVLEHMMFKGTAELKPGEFSRRVAALGGRENAFTMRDATGYFQQIPAGKLEEVMKLEADRFAHNQWPDDEFRRELEVVKEERRLRTEDAPRALLWEVLNAAVFQASPYRRPIIGWMSDLDAMTPQDARDFYKRWYVPANAVVVVAGDVDPAQVLRLAQKHYGRHPGAAGAASASRAPSRSRSGVRRIEFKAPAEQAYVALAFKVPQLTSFEPGPENDDALALTVLAAVLDGYSGARLDRALTQGPDRRRRQRRRRQRPVGTRPAAVHAGRRAGAGQDRRAGRSRAARRSRQGGARGRDRSRTQSREDPMGRRRGVQARLGHEPGARARRLLGPGPAAGRRRAPDPALARRDGRAGQGRRGQVFRRRPAHRRHRCGRSRSIPTANPARPRRACATRRRAPHVHSINRSGVPCCARRRSPSCWDGARRSPPSRSSTGPSPAAPRSTWWKARPFRWWTSASTSMPAAAAIPAEQGRPGQRHRRHDLQRHHAPRRTAPAARRPIRRRWTRTS